MLIITLQDEEKRDQHVLLTACFMQSNLVKRCVQKFKRMDQFISGVFSLRRRNKNIPRVFKVPRKLDACNMGSESGQ